MDGWVTPADGSPRIASQCRETISALSGQPAIHRQEPHNHSTSAHTSAKQNSSSDTKVARTLLRLDVARAGGEGRAPLFPGDPRAAVFLRKECLRRTEIGCDGHIPS